MRGLADFVNGGFPLPASPIYDGMGDFVNGGFPLPQTPVYFPSSAGSLPKSPDMTMADITGRDECSGGMGCGCSSCGMGAFDMASIQNLIPGETFGVPNTYLALGVVAALLMFSGASSRRRR